MNLLQKYIAKKKIASALITKLAASGVEDDIIREAIKSYLRGGGKIKKLPLGGKEPSQFMRVKGSTHSANPQKVSKSTTGEEFGTHLRRTGGLKG